MSFQTSDGIVFKTAAPSKVFMFGSLTVLEFFRLQDIGDNAVTSSIKIAQVFSELVGKTTRAIWKVYGGMLKNISLVMPCI